MNESAATLAKRHAAAAAIGLLMGIGLVAGTPTSADAYVIGDCRYAPGTIDPISWRYFSVGSIYVTASNHGFSAWNSTATDGYFEQHSLSLDPEVNVTDDAYNDTTYAWWAAGCTSDGYYSGNEGDFVWNTSSAGSRSATQKKRIAVHELGHAYGLDHVGSGSGAGCRIMRTDVGQMTDCTITYPAADDIAGANFVN